jgi:hypothetical protein
MNSRLQRHEVHLRGLKMQSAKADFVLLQVQFQLPLRRFSKRFPRRNREK